MGWYSFGPFKLDAAGRVLFRHSQPVTITAKIFQLLLVLVQNRGRVMTKDELLSVVWSDTSVEEANLAQSISVLRRILSDSPKEHRYIATVPGRGYQFVASVIENPSEKSPPVAEPNPLAGSSNRRSWRDYVGPAAAVVVLFSIGGYFLREQPSLVTFYSSVPFTSYKGAQICPTFAPDGERIAFAWNGENEDNFDIYVKKVGGDLPLRMTTGPEPDISPAWSPDGKTIAFLHVVTRGQAEVQLMSATAPGPTRKLRTVTTMPFETYFHFRFMDWSPDARWIVLSDGPHIGGVMSLILLSIDTGECRQLTLPPSGYDDFSPAFSPDLRQLAFVRYSSLGARAGDLYVLKLGSNGMPSGEPERLTHYNRRTASPVWTRDGRTILFVRYESGGSASLWRVHMGRERRVEPIPIPAENSFTVALSPRGNKLVYTRESELANIWAAELNSEGRPRRARQQITSTWGEDNPQFSPDGRLVVYQSARSGRNEIWICDRDGSHPRQLTDLGATVSGFPRWSPDGTKIAFHSRPQALASLYAIDAAGGKPRQLTSQVGDNTTPSWSHDGRWIYFGSRRTGQSHIWRMSATGGPATQMTDRSGWCPLESKDGRVLYYTAMDNGALRAVSLTGGPEREVLTGLAGYGTAYAPAAHGVYAIRTTARGHGQELVFLDNATGHITSLGGIPKPVSLGLALSPEEDLLLFTQIDRRSSDLMMVENFR